MVLSGERVTLDSMVNVRVFDKIYKKRAKLKMQREIKIKEGYKIQINKVYALEDLQSSWREEYEI